MLGAPGTLFNITSQGDFLKKLFHLICAVCSLPWWSLCSQRQKDKGAAPVTSRGSAGVRTKILFWFPDQRVKLCSSQASQIQSPTWGGTWPPDSTVWVAATGLSLQQSWRFQLARVSSSPRSKAEPQPLHSYSHLARKCPMEGLISVD